MKIKKYWFDNIKEGSFRTLPKNSFSRIKALESHSRKPYYQLFFGFLSLRENIFIILNVFLR